MKKKCRKSKTTLFDPDSIATELESALTRDLGGLIQEYETHPTPINFLAYRQVQEFQKKYCPVDTDKKRLERAAFADVLATNAFMGVANTRIKSMFENLPERIQSSTPFMDKVLMRARALVRFVLGPFDEETWFSLAKNSAGSSLGVPFVDTSPEAKFSFPISATERCEPVFERYLQFDSLLKEALEIWGRGHPLSEGICLVTGSRGTTVDKTADKRRFIAIEPTANMFLQQGLMAFMYGRLKSVGLSVTRLPEEHQVRARHASITGREATIDWQSASNCVSIELVRGLLPLRWFEAAWSVRTDFCTIAGEEHELAMFATMGNATTFPLETLAFWSIAHGVRLSLRPGNSLFPEWEDLKSCSVFGDDCIVATGDALKYIECLTQLGFVVNDQKSFYDESGRFRESCGGDYLAGYDTRPYHLRAPPTRRLSGLEPWLYTIANAVTKRYISCFGSLAYVYDKEFFRLIVSLFERHGFKIKLVPSSYPDDAGLHLSHDIERFAACYAPRLSDITVDEHGTYRFRYCRFQYWQHLARSDALRYAIWIKSPRLTDKQVTMIRGKPKVTDSPWVPHVLEEVVRPKRKRGGYVVSVGFTCHWHVPRLNGALN